jgi:hypothetical protein
MRLVREELTALTKLADFESGVQSVVYPHTLGWYTRKQAKNQGNWDQGLDGGRCGRYFKNGQVVLEVGGSWNKQECMTLKKGTIRRH